MSPTATDAGLSQLRDWMGMLEDLAGTVRMLEWDRETVMPIGAADGRGHQIATLSALRHREIIAPGVDEMIEAAAASPDLTTAERAMVRLARRERARAEQIPESLVREISAATTAGIASWVVNRSAGDFASFVPALSRIVDVMRELGEALDVGDEPYDGLLDEHEPGMRTADLEPMFTRLGSEVSHLLSGISDRDVPGLPSGRDWPEAAQLAFAHELAEMVGFRFRSGLVSLSLHPFTTSPHVGDVRFTTRIAPDDPTVNALVTLHEVGHALYSQGHPAEYARTLVHMSPSLGAEESQARFYENHIGRDLQLWEAIAPMLERHFGAVPDISGRDFHARVNHIARTPIRVDADQLTYDLHIAVRFAIELALIRGELDVADIPDAWNHHMLRLVGIAPANQRDGCLQDIHWALGSFGYFPTYTIGNIYAAQLRETIEAEMGPIGDMLQRGEVLEITRFLHDRVHRFGSIMPTRELMERATGQPFSLEPFLRRASQLAADAR